MYYSLLAAIAESVLLNVISNKLTALVFFCELNSEVCFLFCRFCIYAVCKMIYAERDIVLCTAVCIITILLVYLVRGFRAKTTANNSKVYPLLALLQSILSLAYDTSMPLNFVDIIKLPFIV